MTPIDIKSKGVTSLTLRSFIKYAGAASAILDFINRKGDSSIMVKGNLLTSAGTIPVNFNFELW